MNGTLNKRIYSIDFIKFLATICIICHHYQIYTFVQFSSGINFKSGIFYFGYLVELFFVISGFLTSKYIPKIKAGLSLSNFIVPKWKRFFIPQLLSCSAFSLLLIAYEHIYKSVFYDRSFSLWGLITSSIGLSSNWGFEQSKINGTIWYISILLFCFFLFYVVCWLAQNLKINENWIFAFIILIGCQTKLNNYNFMWLNPTSSRGYVGFFWGLILAQYLHNSKNSKKILITSLILVVIFPVLYTLWYDSYMKNGIDYLLIFLFFTPLIILANSNFANNIFKHKFWGIVGEISFEAYIWHFPVILALLVTNGWLGLDLNYHSRYLMLIVVLISFLVGTLMYFTIDKKYVKNWIHSSDK